MMGTRYLLHIAAMVDTSAVDLGYATATGRPMLIEDHSEYPCCWRSSGSMEIVSSSPVAFRISAIA